MAGFNGALFFTPLIYFFSHSICGISFISLASEKGVELRLLGSCVFAGEEGMVDGANINALERMFLQ